MTDTVESLRGELAAAKNELNGVLRLVQVRLQPRGSPPPGNAYMLVDWITATARDDLERAYKGEPHPTHQWSGKVLNQCLRCGAWHGQECGRRPCDPDKIAGKVCTCCECGEDFPLADNIAGEIFCRKCRETEK
jgi:hypothetical protein